MRCLLTIVLSAIACACTGCLYCENGLCSAGEPEAIFDPALLGEWVWTDSKPHKGEEGYFEVVRDAPDSKAYRITAVTTADTKPPVPPYVFKAYLTRFGESLFLDAVLPPEPGSRGGGSRHLIWRVDIKMPEMTARPLSEDFVRAHPDSLPQSVAHSPLGVEFVTVTATTRELGDFVRKHTTSDTAWKGPAGILRLR